MKADNDSNLPAKHNMTTVRVAPPTKGTWRSNDYANAIRLVDGCSLESMK